MINHFVFYGSIWTMAEGSLCQSSRQNLNVKCTMKPVMVTSKDVNESVAMQVRRSAGISSTVSSRSLDAWCPPRTARWTSQRFSARPSISLKFITVRGCYSQLASWNGALVCTQTTSFLVYQFISFSVFCNVRKRTQCTYRKEKGFAPIFLVWLAAYCATSPCKPLKE